MSIATRLSELGIELSDPALPVANYVPYVLEGGMLYLSGQVPLVEGKPYLTGRLGENVSIEEGMECARRCTISALAWVRHALDGDLARVRRVVRVRGFVASTPDFHEQPQVLNGASDLLVAVFGESGRHARAAVGSVALPLGVPVEIDFQFAVS